jgi:hypothetical protein
VWWYNAAAHMPTYCACSPLVLLLVLMQAHLQNVLGKEPGKGGGGGGKSGLEGADMHQLLAAQDSSRVLYGNNLAQVGGCWYWG